MRLNIFFDYIGSKMPCCIAVNCSRRSEMGFRLFRFPKDKRRDKWVKNMARENWKPTDSSRLCEKHFEDSQFENHRADGWRKLKPNAVPTLFNIPNIIRNPNNNNIVSTDAKQLNSQISTSEQVQNAVPDVGNDTPVTLESKVDVISKLKEENKALRQQLEAAQSVMHSTLKDENEKLRRKIDNIKKLLNDEQIRMLQEGRISHWPNETIIKGLKFRFALSIHGYEFLRSTGYPLPSYSTLMRRIQAFKLNFGIFTDVLELLRYKAEAMEASDRFCILSNDEMAINEKYEYDKSSGKFVGNVTLGEDDTLLGQKIYVVVARGIKNRWKQIIACHITHKESIDPNQISEFMLECIASVEACGLHVLSLSSDLNERSRSLWSSLNISAKKVGARQNAFTFNEHEIYALPDVYHLLKALKSSVLKQKIYLPETYVEVEKLPTNVVDGSHVVRLWNHEISNGQEKRLLNHLRKQDIEPSNFDEANAGAAIRFFSSKTASALKTAVVNGILPGEVLSTAEFILVIEKWFSLVTSQTRRTSITARNCDQKYIFFHAIIDLFQNIIFDDSWHRLNYGFVLTTSSFCDIAEFLFKKGFDFILGHHFTQDVTKNIFSQIWKKQGHMPSALKALQAIRNISVVQFVSDVKHTSYLNDSDEFLLNFCQKKRKLAPE